MNKQEIKIECNENKFFFFAHSFKTALEHANAFVTRNKGKFEMKLFVLNESNFGEKWRLKEVYRVPTNTIRIEALGDKLLYPKSPWSRNSEKTTTDFCIVGKSRLDDKKAEPCLAVVYLSYLPLTKLYMLSGLFLSQAQIDEDMHNYYEAHPDAEPCENLSNSDMILFYATTVLLDGDMCGGEFEGDKRYEDIPDILSKWLNRPAIELPIPMLPKKP